MRTATVIFLSLLFALPATVGADPETAESSAALETATRLLRMEFDLARKPQLYFLFDLDGNVIRFKASGLAVAELPVTERRIWGPLPPLEVRTVAKKESRFAPERQKITIPDGEKKEEEQKEEGPFELKALELSDMPTSFRAEFNDGTHLTVRAVAEGFFPKVGNACRTLYWYLTRPLISDWHFLHGKTYTEVRLLLPARDVQLLYWSLSEGSLCLVGWPSAK